jgi:hypothetical protein
MIILFNINKTYVLVLVNVNKHIAFNAIDTIKSSFLFILFITVNENRDP